MSEQKRSGLHEWQALIVRLWGESDDAVAALTLSLQPEGTREGPWTARLMYGDAGADMWSTDIWVASAPSIQQALIRLSARAKKLLVNFPGFDIAEDDWFTAEELAVVERLTTLLKSRQPGIVELRYQPELGMSSSWVGVLYDDVSSRMQYEGRSLHAGELMQICGLLIEAIEAQTPRDAEAPV